MHSGKLSVTLSPTKFLDEPLLTFCFIPIYVKRFYFMTLFGKPSLVFDRCWNEEWTDERMHTTISTWNLCL